jgi:hypothetical protein
MGLEVPVPAVLVTAVTSCQSTPPEDSAMKLPRLQFTMRRMMILTAGIGMITWLLVAAEQIRREPNS